MATRVVKTVIFDKDAETVDSASKTKENTNIIQVKMIKNENLFDCKYNIEDVEDTLDLENSICELGFIDPLEVTDFFNIGENNYTIISGHRRRRAGVKANIDKFPCIIKSFKSEEEVKNYILLSNSYRDSSKDPLLMCKRYKAHEAYLDDIKFKGSKREEIAKRLGVSVDQADRYNRFNKIITPVWDLVRDGKVGMSSVLGMAVYDENEQENIFCMLLYNMFCGKRLTRENCEDIIRNYKPAEDSSVMEIKDSADEKPKEEILTIDIPSEIDTFINALKREYKFSDKNSAILAMEKMCSAIETILIEIKNIIKNAKLN